MAPEVDVTRATSAVAGNWWREFGPVRRARATRQPVPRAAPPGAPATLPSVMRQAWADGLATVRGEQTLDVYFPRPEMGEPPERGGGVDPALSALEREDDLRGVRIAARRVSADLDGAIAGADDAYLRLHLLSHRLVRPNDINLDGIFGALANVCWTSIGPVDPEDLPAVQLRARSAGVGLVVHGVDKFPRMVDYVVPSGVRIADASRVRLGAHLAAGTTVMHEGFVNYNAGTLGAAMVEGRISQGVVVGDGSDIGGGASTMGTLSGGGTERVSIGRGCLLGANSGLGIALGDNCVVEAGLYLTAGTVVSLPDGTTAKARQLSGRSDLLFRRNSLTGAVEVLSRTGSWGALNAALHADQ